MRSEIAGAAREAGVAPGQFRLLRLHEYEDVLAKILEQFTTLSARGANATWLWDGHLKAPHFGVQAKYGEALATLGALLDAETSYCYWLLLSDEPPWRGAAKRHGNFWVCEGTGAAIAAVLEHLIFDEFYVIHKKLEWLLCLNHHDVFIAVGEPMVARLRHLEGP